MSELSFSSFTNARKGLSINTDKKKKFSEFTDNSGGTSPIIAAL